jgi:hypothetical protein
VGAFFPSPLDWNISWKELQEVVELGVLTREEAEDAVSNEFNPIRAVFHGAEDKVGTAQMLLLSLDPRNSQMMA